MIAGREGPLVQAMGEERLALLELLAMNSSRFEVGEKLYIGKEGRTKITSVLGRIAYEELTDSAKNDLAVVAESIVTSNEARYTQYFNELQPLTPRLHALELIPGIGKTFMKQIIDEREKSPFKNFEDLQKRVQIREPIKLVAKRIVEEISGGSRVYIFTGR